MIDFGLLMSVIVALAAPTLAARIWPLRTFEPGTNVLDAMVLPAATGLVTGRLVTLALDDPRSIGRIADMLVIRSGVEFWPAVLAAALVAAWSGRRERIEPLARLVDLAPLALVGYGAYEAACLVRDGCYGPVSPVGLRPDGMSTTMLPIGLLMAAGVVASAAAVRHLRLVWSCGAIVAAAVALLAIVRGLGSIWLPRVGDILTRQHRTSLVVAIVAAGVCLVQVLVGRRQAVEGAPA